MKLLLLPNISMICLFDRYMALLKSQNNGNPFGSASCGWLDISLLD